MDRGEPRCGPLGRNTGLPGPNRALAFVLSARAHAILRIVLMAQRRRARIRGVCRRP